MVNMIVYNYLRENYGKHDLNVMRKKILAGGYTVEDYENSLARVKLDGFTAPKKKGLSFIWVFFFSFFLLLLLLAYFVLS